MTAADLRAMYRMPWTRAEIEAHARQVAAFAHELSGYHHVRMPPELLAALEADGFTYTLDGVISWAETPARPEKETP